MLDASTPAGDDRRHATRLPHARNSLELWGNLPIGGAGGGLDDWTMIK